MTRVVTIAIPIYKRLSTLPAALESVLAQDYPHIDLLVSDNGENGPEVREIVEAHYPRPFRFRRNDRTVPSMSLHFNQLVENAEGDYFVLLCDDDLISPNFASTLAGILDAEPDVGIALPRVDTIDFEGRHGEEGQDRRFPPERFTGVEFARMWSQGGYAFLNFATNMARTREILDVGGYAQIPGGNGDDDMLALKLALGRRVAYARDVVFFNRWYEESAGLAISPWELAADVKAWLECLKADPILERYAASHPEEWDEVRRLMEQKGWKTFRHRYKRMYRRRMNRLAWIRAGFALPYLPEYYRWLIPYLGRHAFARMPRER